MSTEKMRADFEKFRDQRNAVLEREGHKPGSKWHVTNAHYPTWQASRAAIEVELPSLRAITMGRRENEHDSGFNAGVELCIDAIESLGLKVKP